MRDFILGAPRFGRLSANSLEDKKRMDFYGLRVPMYRNRFG